MVVKKKIILASRSFRRQHLLRQIGLQFDVRESHVEEEFDLSKTPEENVQILAIKKATEVAKSIDDGIIIGADTIVVLDNKIFGKPSNFNHACEMLKTLSGRTHEVYTGFALVNRPLDISISGYEVTKVKFRDLTDDEIIEYVKSGSPMDKAGAYGIQDDYGAVFVEKVEGCYYNVVGLPLAKFYKQLEIFQKQLGL